MYIYIYIYIYIYLYLYIYMYIYMYIYIYIYIYIYVDESHHKRDKFLSLVCLSRVTRICVWRVCPYLGGNEQFVACKYVMLCI